MNIYELEKQATPGPFGFRYQSAAKSRAEALAAGCNTDGGGSTGHVLDGKDSGYGRHVMAHMSINRDPKQDAQHYADVVLLAHCRNNFMKAVTLLSKIVVTESIIRGGSGDLSGNSDFKAQIQEAREALAELEEIEV